MGEEWDVNKRKRCGKCDEPMPRVYKECWICMNSSCGMFWRDGLVEAGPEGPLQSIPIPSKLSWHKTFLMSRTTYGPDMRPSWDLRPDLKQALDPPWEPSQGKACAAGTMRMRSAWRGAVCPACKAIVPAVNWCVWRCQMPQCGWRLRVDFGPMPLRAAVPRMFTSWRGHAMLEPDWAKELGGQGESSY